MTAAIPESECPRGKVAAVTGSARGKQGFVISMPI
jgi:hypothetical protein